MDYEKFINYEKEKEPEKHEKTYIWKTAIGLQKVDDLTPSDYLYEIAKKNIENNISFNDANKLINSYYKEKPIFENRTEEADKVSVKIAELISGNSFVFSPIEYINIHKVLFSGIYKYAGKIRDYNISKKEWVLNQKSVSYGNYYNLQEMLEYDFEKEKNFSYKGLSEKEFVSHIAKFVSNLWQIHIFGEGNTRTTAVFLIKYLKSMGFDVNNDLFSENSWYFRNSLVRANYSNFEENIEETTYYLELFLENLLFNKNHQLSNKKLHIYYEKLENLNLNEKHHKLIELFESNPKITLQECADITNISLRSVKSMVKTLSEKGVIERVGSKKTGLWKVL